MPTAQLDDVDLFYEIAGNGPPVLFISGTGGDLRQRPSVFEGPLTKECTVLAYDQRGLGQSSKLDRDSTMADYADDAAGLLAAVGWSTAGVVGASFGGMVAQELAIRHPALVDRLVLCCTSSGGAGGSSYPLHELADLSDDERRRRSLALSDVRHDRAWQDANPTEAAVLLEFMQAREAANDDDPDAAAGATRQLATRRGHDTWHRLEHIKMPTLVCAGRYDGIAPVENSEALASRIPDARLEVFEGGHMFLIQDRRVWPVLLDFVRAPGT